MNAQDKQITFPATGNLYFKTAYTLPGVSDSAVNLECSSLRPSAEVASLIRGIDTKNAIGVHVRQRAHDDELQGLTGDEYMQTASRLMVEKHRAVANFENFKPVCVQDMWVGT